jgi:ATP-dependent RNA circularization protein (DNA/RNA ligase family)
MRDFIFPQISRNGFLSVCDGVILTSREKNAQWAARSILYPDFQSIAPKVEGAKQERANSFGFER